MLSLDVGCGGRKIGDVGVDVDRTSNADVIADFIECLFVMRFSLK
jgi:hypothetical protein